MFKNTFLWAVVGILVFTLSSCKMTKETIIEKKVSVTTPLNELYSLMQGSYDSSKQANENTSYYNITLHMYPIWENDPYAKWLYVEQSVTANQEKPYRQRIYKLMDKGDGTLASYVYKMEADSLYIGKWKEPDFFTNKGKEILQIREGCEVIMNKIRDGSFSGSTIGENCKSTLRGASYATSKVTITKGTVSSWDQGFDENGKQVWGAVDGAYIFTKTIE